MEVGRGAERRRMEKRRNKKMMKENKSHKCYKCNISLKISIKFPKTFVKHFTAPMISAASFLQSDTHSEYQTHTLALANSHIHTNKHRETDTKCN